MAETPLEGLRQFFDELKRRNVYRVAVTYVTVAFVGFQAARLLIPTTVLPSWSDEFFLFFLIVGFPVALVVAWAFEMTPEGVRRTADGEPHAEEESPHSPAGESRTPYRILVGLGLAAAAVAGVWYLTGGGGERGTRAGARSIAVLPFEELGQAQPGTFTEGMHEAVLLRLSNVSGLTVISSRSVQRYRETGATPSEIARELGVRWILEGSVQEMGDRIQVSVQLVDPISEATRWGDSYRRSLTTADLFALQSDIVKEISRSLDTQLTPEETERVERRPTGSMEAYRLYVRGRSLLDQRTEAGMRQAADWFRRAIARDSGYATAWAGLADALALLEDYGYAETDSVLPLARQAADRALELDPHSSEAHASSALLHGAVGEGPASIRQMQRAVELRPSYGEAHNWLSWGWLLLGRPQQALPSARRAVDQDPLSPEAWSNVALSWLAVGRPDSALKAVGRARQLQPEYATATLYEAMALAQVGRSDSARALLLDLEISWAPSAPRATMAVLEVAGGDSAAARSILEELRHESESSFYPGLVHAALGQRDSALAAFRRVEGWGRSPLLAWPNMSLRYLYPGPLDPLRRDGALGELVRSINRGWGLSPDGSLPLSGSSGTEPGRRTGPGSRPR